MRNVLPEKLDEALECASLGAILTDLESAKIMALTEWAEKLRPDQLRRVHDYYRDEEVRHKAAEFEAVRLAAMTNIACGSKSHKATFPEYAHTDPVDDISKKGAE
jgi:hypothetical protein